MKPFNGRVVSLWVVFDHPRDFPRHIVVREQRVASGQRIAHAFVACLYQTVNEVMKEGERCGLTFLPRDRSDDPCIIGSWV